MRNKIKQLLKKEDGFTLVELLGVIVILGIILAIAIPSIGGIVDNARVNTAKAQEELIIDAAKMAELDGKLTDIPTAESLIKAGYLEETEFKNSKNVVVPASDITITKDVSKNQTTFTVDSLDLSDSDE